MSNEEKIQNEVYGLNIAIPEMQKLLERQRYSIQSNKATARTLLGSASLIVSLIGALQLLNARVPSEFLWIYNLAILVSMILYLTLISICVYILGPKNVSSATADDWDLIYEDLTGKSKKEILRKQLHQYLLAIKENEIPIQRLWKLVRLASILLPIIVAILLGLSLIPRTPLP